MTKEEFSRRIIAMTGVMYRIAWSQLPQQADREDAVQETIRRAWEKRDSLRDERYMQTWVIRILLNVCDTIRRRSTRMTPSEYVPAVTRQAQDPPLLNALLSLDERFRLPLQLRYVEGCSVREVAQILKVSEGTVKSRLSRGRDKLRSIIDEEVFEE